MTGSVDLSWDDNSDVENGFGVQRAISGNTLSEIATVGSNTTTYSDSTVVDAKTYDYAIDAHNAAGDSSPTATVAVTTQLSPPSGFTVSASTTAGEIDLSWTRNDDNPNGEWQIYRSSTSTPIHSTDYSQVATVSDPTTTTYTDTGLSDGTKYHYFIRRSVNGQTRDTNDASAVTTVVETGVSTQATITPSVTETATATESSIITNAAASPYASDEGITTESDVFTQATATTKIVYLPPLPRMGINANQTDADVRHGQNF